MIPPEINSRIPLISDQLLIDLVNGIHVNQDLIRYRKSRGFFGQIIDGAIGQTSKHQNLLNQNVVKGQQALLEITTELANKLSFSQYALTLTQQSLIETRDVLNRNTQHLNHLENNQEILQNELTHLIDICGKKCNDQEKRLAKIECSLEAQRDFDRIFSRWESGQTYTGLPWAIQIIFLTRELYNSSIAYLELDQKDYHYRQLLTNKIIAHHQPHLPQHFFTTPNLLHLTWQASDSNDIPLITDVLSSCIYPTLPPEETPLLATLTNVYQHNQLEMPTSFLKTVPHTLYAQEYIQRIIQETANSTLAQLTCRSLPC